MSMYTRVKGIVPANDEYKKMLHVYDACVGAEIDVPDAVMDFFDGETPNRNGMEVEVEFVKDDSVEMENSIIVDLDRLPRLVRKLKFTNSY